MVATPQITLGVGADGRILKNTREGVETRQGADGRRITVDEEYPSRSREDPVSSTFIFIISMD